MDAVHREALADKLVLVTGASRGIGARIAINAAACGAHVLLVARGHEALQSVADDITAAGGRASVYAVDLSDADAVAQLGTTVLAEHGGVDVLVHNAARSIRRPIEESTERLHDFSRTMTLNYFSAVQLTLALLPSLRARSGHVCLVLTMGVLIPGPYFAAYLASKAALDAFGDSLAAEFAHEGLSVSSIYLPLVKTAMMAPTKAYEGRTRLWTADKAANVILDTIAARKRRMITGQGVWLGWSNLFNSRATTRALNFLFRAFPPRGASAHPRAKRFIERVLGGSPL